MAGRETSHFVVLIVEFYNFLQCLTIYFSVVAIDLVGDDPDDTLGDGKCFKSCLTIAHISRVFVFAIYQNFPTNPLHLAPQKPVNFILLYSEMLP